MKKILFFIPILTLMFNTVFAMPTKTNDEIIADYPFTNRVNELSVSEKQEITKTLTACADVMQVSSYGSSSVSGELKILKDGQIDVNGKNVIIAEDIIDSGNTLSALVKLLKKRGANF